MSTYEEFMVILTAGILLVSIRACLKAFCNDVGYERWKIRQIRGRAGSESPSGPNRKVAERLSQ